MVFMMPSPGGIKYSHSCFTYREMERAVVALRLPKYLIRHILESFWKDNVKKKKQEMK